MPALSLCGSALCVWGIFDGKTTPFIKEWFGTDNKYHGRQRLYLPLRFFAIHLQRTDWLHFRIWAHTVVQHNTQPVTDKKAHIKICSVPIKSIFSLFYHKTKKVKGKPWNIYSETKNPVNRKLLTYKEFEWFWTWFPLKKRLKTTKNLEKAGQSSP